MTFFDLIFLIHSIACVRFIVINIVRGAINRWLDSGHDDGLIERELDVLHYVQTPPPQEPMEDEPGFFLFLLFLFLLIVLFYFSLEYL